MANNFSIILVVITLITGVIWFLDKFFWTKKRQTKLEQSQSLSPLDQAQKHEVLHQRSWLVENSVSTFPVLAFVVILRSFIYEPFQIPSGSMFPTLLVGDFILVEKFSYGLKDPIWRNELVATGKPKRGDVAVFKYPQDPSIDYIKRIIGLPGDTIIYLDDKQICIKASDESECNLIKLTNMKQSNLTSNVNGTNVKLLQFNEQLAQKEHKILIDPLIANRVEHYFPNGRTNKWIVPEGQYFVLGDNRDNSLDSRYWGFVPESHLVGRAVAIWISFEFERTPDSVLPKWVPTGVRLDRIGSIH